MKNNNNLHTTGSHHFNEGIEKFCGVREDPRDQKQAFGAHLHNHDKGTRKLLAHVNEDLIDSDFTLSEPKYNYDIHKQKVKEYNFGKLKKDHLDLETSRTDLKFYSKGRPIRKSSEEGKRASAAYIEIKKSITKRLFDNKPRISFEDYTKEQREEELKQTLFEQTGFKYETKIWKYDQNSSMFEQVLYFSRSINEENISDKEWKRLIGFWKKHMEVKYGVIMMNTAMHKSERTHHIHMVGSNLKDGKFNGNRLQTVPGYGSDLQTEFASLVKRVLPNLKEEYKRGNKKAVKGNDHSDQNEAVQEAEQVIKIVDKFERDMEKGVEVKDVLEQIQGLKASYSNNKTVKKLLNLLQRTLGHVEKELEDSKETIDELIQDVENFRESFMDIEKEKGEADDLIAEVTGFFEDSSSEFKKRVCGQRGGVKLLRRLGVDVGGGGGYDIVKSRSR
jgi:predicted RNase H-related nuclease YkuK (DUF458 family)